MTEETRVRLADVRDTAPMQTFAQGNGRNHPAQVESHSRPIERAVMTRPLEGRVALVTGASRGIGRAIALELARAGATVAVNYPDAGMEAQTAEVVKEILGLGRVALPVRADVSVVEQAQEMIRQVTAELGQIDILVNNAGITRDRTLRKLTPEDWRKVIEVDLSSVFHCTWAAVPFMVERNYGRIVNISSVVAQTGNIGQTNYAAAKAGILGFTKSAALELARYNITVNAVCPGFTATSMTEAIPEDILGQIKAKIPLGRLALPEEIAETTLFLVRSNYITGQQISVNGGLYM